MRRLTLTAMSVAVVLSACSEQNRETPTEPNVQSPSAAKAATGTCQNPFPTTALTSKTGAMFAGASVSNAATSKMQSVQSQCAKGKVGNARAEALTFVDWMLKKYKDGQLPNGTALKLTAQISTLLAAVGFQNGEIDPGAFGPDGAAGVYDGTSEFRIQNANKSASFRIPASSGGQCLPPSLITMIRLPNTPQLINTGGRRQFAPFYDINAANEAGDHTLDLNNCQEYTLGFCIDNAGKENPQIGHNLADDLTTEGNEEGDFEVLQAAGPDAYANLDLAFCPTQGNPGFDDEYGGFSSLNSSGSLGSMAFAAWHNVGRYARPLAESLFLPQMLHAAVLTNVGLGGRGSTASPFGGVDDVVPSFGTDPGEGDGQPSYDEGSVIETCGESCFPSVNVQDFFEDGVKEVPVSVSLVRVSATSGELSFGEDAPGPVLTDNGGEAEFDNLRVINVNNGETGTYKLKFTIPGNTDPLFSGEFTINPGD